MQSSNNSTPPDSEEYRAYLQASIEAAAIELLSSDLIDESTRDLLYRITMRGNLLSLPRCEQEVGDD